MQYFQKKPTVKEQVRISQREITGGVRDLERELLSIDREEKKLIKEIKDAARTGNEKGARLLAKSLVRLRGQRTKVLASSAQLRGVRASIGTAAVTAKMGESMAKASEAMAAMGQTNDPAKIAQTMQQFQKENAKMEMGQEMMDDNLDGIFDDDDTEAETSDLMNQVLDEIGVDITAQMGSAPAKKVAAPQKVSAAAQDEEDNLTARLAALK
ncbi:Charged multivesicular body protein 2b [Coccomyxa sp. Obi]|nr:Charged multivesicular body protein 2b [Coccomyxa sp. Obi]